MLAWARSYGVKAINFGGCIKGSPIHPGQAAAMRRSAHAHSVPGPQFPHYGTICFKAMGPERISGRWFWHEVAHIWRRSWTEGECSAWARRQVRMCRPRPSAGPGIKECERRGGKRCPSGSIG